jgi:hypothetical protein
LFSCSAEARPLTRKSFSEGVEAFGMSLELGDMQLMRYVVAWVLLQPCLPFFKGFMVCKQGRIFGIKSP